MECPHPRAGKRDPATRVFSGPRSKAVLRILEQARDRALELAKANADAIRRLAAIVYRERRLTDERVTAALRSVGLHPAEIRP